ncbi:unnamed protein product [Prorocentrum cordatum]|uniref:Uncharacterized protein n=1 Tax=Prorocentrum cordatum TaxID=2364126 RepID=A0ABN9W9Z0_9DINO|nr:unnamed protein product [Polarella glacialis]
MDAVLALCLNDCFHCGVSDHGAQLLASLAHFYPSLRNAWKVQWPRATRASVAWKRRVPAGAQLPMPKAAAMAVCLLLVEAGAPWMAVWVAMSFVAYLRPGETFRLEGGGLVPPSPAAGSQCRDWGLPLREVASLVPGKTGLRDESVLIDMGPWLIPALEYLRARRSLPRTAFGHSRPRPFDYSTVNA